MIDTKLPVTVFQPEASIEIAAAFADLRTALYRAQLQDAGASVEQAFLHTAPWASIAYEEFYLEKLRSPDRYYCRGLLMAGQLVGVFMGDLEPGNGTFYGNDDQLPGSKYVAEIQLASSVQRQGHGQRLMAGFMGVDDRSTSLHVFDNNISGRGFYRKQGFKETGYKANVMVAGQELGRRLLRKHVNKGMAT